MTLEENQHGGLTVWTTAVFIIGEIAGGGVLALPKATEDTGWIGIPLLVLFTLVSTYTGTLMGKSWLLIQNRFPEYRTHVPDPYPVIGEKAYGKYGRHLVTGSINFTLFGAATAYLIIASENIEQLMSEVTKDISFCYWLLILGGVLIPVTCFGTPKDFWPIAVGATLSTGIACILILIQVLQDKVTAPKVQHSSTDLMKFAGAFGTIVFSVSGHPAFPTFIADMKKTSNFKWAVFVGYIIVLLMYLPTTTSGFLVYGKDLNPNILKNLTSGPITYIIEILLTLHLIFGYLILINPVCQELEAKFGVPKAFTWKRCVARPIIVLSALFVAETIPHFGVILSLVGGSTTTLLSFICPCLFYLKLCKKEIKQTQFQAVYTEVRRHIENAEDGDSIQIIGTQTTERTQLTNSSSTPNQDLEHLSDYYKADPKEHSDQKCDKNMHTNMDIFVPLWEKVFNYQIILVGAVAGLAATISAISSLLSPDSFSVPCYVHASI